MGSTSTESSTTNDLRLWDVLTVAAVLLFVALVIGFTGSAAPYWPLLIIPVVLAAIFFHVPGAIVASVASIATLVVVAPTAVDSGAGIAQVAVGFAAFLVSGIVIGIQTSRSTMRANALEQSSYRDEQTGLYKPAYLRQRLVEEVRRASRHEVEVGLLVVRVDGLAQFHETFGAYKAGLLMAHLADVLRITVRDTDVVGRYGPESFAVILPFGGPAEAMLVSDRVRVAACAAEFEGDVLQPSAHCPVSVAFAAFPAEATSLEALVALVADRLGDTAPDFETRAPSGTLRFGEVHP